MPPIVPGNKSKSQEKEQLPETIKNPVNWKYLIISFFAGFFVGIISFSILVAVIKIILS